MSRCGRQSAFRDPDRLSRAAQLKAIAMRATKTHMVRKVLDCAHPLALWGSFLISFCMAGYAQEDPPSRTQARSIVISRYGIVAAEHPFASQAGAKILPTGADGQWHWRRSLRYRLRG